MITIKFPQGNINTANRKPKDLLYINFSQIVLKLGHNLTFLRLYTRPSRNTCRRSQQITHLLVHGSLVHITSSWLWPTSRACVCNKQAKKSLNSPHLLHSFLTSHRSRAKAIYTRNKETLCQPTSQSAMHIYARNLPCPVQAQSLESASLRKGLTFLKRAGPAYELSSHTAREPGLRKNVSG